ncbi:MAG: antitoxin VapB family protein [Halobacteriaceae archaeon]
MGTKTIGLQDHVYERLKARKREGESFTELVDRLLDETTTDWREGFGSLSSDEVEELEQFVTESRTHMSEGLAKRQQEIFQELSESNDSTDETA